MMRRGFPVLARIAVWWPRWLLLLGSRVVIFVVMFVYPKPKAAIARNLAVIYGEPIGSRRVRRGVREMLRHFGYYWADLFRFAQLPVEAGRRHLVRVDGMDAVDELLAAGRGVVLLTAHLGNWELGGVLLGQENVPVSVVYVPDQYPEAEAFRSRLRRASRVCEIPLDLDRAWSSLPLLRALRGGGLVAMQGDRDFRGDGVEGRLFGRESTFPRGPFMVALLAGVPIVPTVFTYTPGLDFQCDLGPPIHLDGSRDREAAVARAVREWTAFLETALRRFPTQWYTFFDYWGSQADGSQAGAPVAGARGAAS